ncbi:S8 family peptidase [Pyxidicoccus trucidator]|uniref:S8 family peptidase n=1 Tax=Pyxidicoccus trucidator TaxID=2709662 RepID=UPI0013D97155|nr:S8 family serine peptidase [Pyxidicoccus trucidator]
MAEVLEGQGTGLFYYADGKKVPLAVSPEYVAVRATGDVKASRALTRLTESISTRAGRGRVMEVPEYQLVVVEVPGGATRGASAELEQVRALLEESEEVSPGPTVYKTPSSARREAIIPAGEVLVKFKSDTAPEARRKALERQGVEVKKTDYPEPGAYLLATRPGQETVELANRLYESGLFEYSQPNFVRLMPRVAVADVTGAGATVPENGKAFGSMMQNLEGLQPLTQVRGRPTGAPVGPMVTPTDPSLSSQWGLQKIRALEAFDISMGSSGISIAIIDEGVNVAHEDLACKLPGYDAVTQTDNQEPQPGDGHGTSCAGIAAARANNGRGGVGVAPNCLVLPIRIARGLPNGDWFTTDAMIADGIRKAVGRGADVLSNSWGGGSPSSVITSAFKFAQTNGRGGRGCPIAIATGNEDLRTVGYPASLSPTIPGLLAVGASNQWDQRKSRSSRDGETWWGSNFGPEVDVVAPGVKIFATDITGAAGYGSGNYVPDFNGTSSATPHVAGLMGLILSVDPDLRSWEVEDIIKLSADELGTAGRDEEFGFGRINCRRALEASSRLWFTVQPTPVFLGTGKECFIRVNFRVFNPGINSVRLDELALVSHGPDNAELDRFQFKATPSGTLAPRSGHELLFNNLLLRAHGNASSWSYRWSLGWSYTFWRPSAPLFARGGIAPDLSESNSRKVPLTMAGQGSGEMPRASRGHVQHGRAETQEGTRQSAVSREEPVSTETGDTVTIDRHSKSITIVIR